MKRYLKYIFISLIVGFSAVSCIQEMESPVSQKPAETLILVPRVKNFANQYITKASDYSGNEKTISKIALLVFNSDGDVINISTSTNASVKLNKTMLRSRMIALPWSEWECLLRL